MRRLRGRRFLSRHRLRPGRPAARGRLVAGRAGRLRPGAGPHGARAPTAAGDRRRAGAGAVPESASAGAINIPYPAAKERAPAELDPSTNIVLVCHAGPMGDEIAAILAARGFPHVRNLAGGMKRWRGPIESGP